MNEFSTIVAGHSHTVCLGMPQISGDNKLVPLPAEGVGGLTGRWPRELGYWEELVRLCPGRTVVLFWQGSQHLAHFLLAPEPKMDFVFSGQPRLPLAPGALIIPEMLLRQLFHPLLAQMGGLIASLNAAGARRVLVGGSPPPKDDDEFCRARMNHEPDFARIAELLGVDLATVPLSPPLLRCKYWALLQDMMHGIALSQSAGFIPVPKAAMTDKGALARQYWAEDVTHANAAYGSLMLAEIVAAVEKEAAHAPV